MLSDSIGADVVAGVRDRRDASRSWQRGTRVRRWCRRAPGVVTECAGASRLRDIRVSMVKSFAFGVLCAAGLLGATLPSVAHAGAVFRCAGPHGEIAITNKPNGYSACTKLPNSDYVEPAAAKARKPAIKEEPAKTAAAIVPEPGKSAATQPDAPEASTPGRQSTGHGTARVDRRHRLGARRIAGLAGVRSGRPANLGRRHSARHPGVELRRGPGHLRRPAPQEPVD